MRPNFQKGRQFK